MPNYDELRAQYCANPPEQAASDIGEQSVQPLEEQVPDDSPANQAPVAQPDSECECEELKPDENDQEPAMPENTESAAQEQACCGELMDLIRNQHAIIGSLAERFDALEQKLTHFQQLAGGLKNIPTAVSELTIAAQKQEKANIDILRDSKNSQAIIRDKLQKELDEYHKMMSETAQIPLFTEIANLYIITKQITQYMNDEKLRSQIETFILKRIEEILTDRGVDIQTSDIGQERSIRRCKTRKTVPTGDKQLHGAVAVSHSPSFSLGSVVFVKEDIDTYVYDPNLAEDDNQACEPDSEPPTPQDEI